MKAEYSQQPFPAIVTAFTTAIALLVMAGMNAANTVRAQEHFVPSDQLDTIFDRDRRGVLMSREEFRDLLAKAKLAETTQQQQPAGILVDRAEVTVQPSDQQALINMTLTIRQFADGWQSVRIPVGHMWVEKTEIEGQDSALVARDPGNPDSLLFVHEGTGVVRLKIVLSAPLASVGSDRSAAFPLPQVPVTELKVFAPAGQHVLVNDLKVNRPAAEDQPAEYLFPMGTADQVRLLWTVQREQGQAQTLVFVRTDAQLQLQKETLRWLSDSRVSVFGGTINRVICRVPSKLEITSVESTGLEGWALDDDPDQPGITRVTLSYRQPFKDDRMIRIQGVTGVTEGNSMAVPTLTYADVTSHAGRIVIAHADGLRLISKTGAGVRPVAVIVGENISYQVSAFDFWQQQYELSVAVRPRDQQLFTELRSSLSVVDTTANLSAAITIETLNAPLFQAQISLPENWQLTEVTSGGVPVEWRFADGQQNILVTPPSATPAGGLLEIQLKLTRTIEDPEAEQKLPLPVVTVTDSTLVGGTYSVGFADDLSVTPLSLTGLRPVGGTGAELFFENVGTAIGGELSVIRKPARLASRAVLRTWSDVRQLTLDAEVSVDVINGTTRTLTVRLPEWLGTDVRFEVLSVGAVPGVESQRVTGLVQIIEQNPLDPVEGLRPFVLKFDKRFSGSVTLHALVRQPRSVEQTELIAPMLVVSDAVRQQGILVFEAYPEQQLASTKDINKVDGLFVVDAGLVDPPGPASGRRVALTYRFVQPVYELNVAETRFGTDAVPSAVVETVNNLCTLSETGGIQRSCTARFRSSGVQTLRFALPDPEHSFLWSTILNGEPVEVRRAGTDYLVALPAQTENRDQEIRILFESNAGNENAFGAVTQGSLRFAMDIGDATNVPVDVLKQTWDVRYPSTALLVKSEGDFEAVDGVDQPGWFRRTFTLSNLTLNSIGPRSLIPAGVVLFMLIVTAVSVRRRWKAVGFGIQGVVAIVCIGAVGLFIAWTMTRIYMVNSRASKFNAVATSSEAVAERASAPGAWAADFEMSQPASESAPASELARQIDPPLVSEGRPSASGAPGFAPPAMEPGVGGYGAEAAGGAIPAPGGMPGGGGGFGGGGRGGDETAPPGVQDGLFDATNQVLPARDDFSGQSVGLQASGAEPRPSDSLVIDPQAVTDQSSLFGDADFDGEDVLRRKAGTARLSVQVALEVPPDYRSREFKSIGDSIRKTGQLELIVQREDQILAYRIVAMLAVLLLCWWIRRREVVTRVAGVVVLGLGVAAAVPMLDNEWQSVADGLLMGGILGFGIWFGDFLVHLVRPIARGTRRIISRLFGYKSSHPAAMILALAGILLAESTTSLIAQETIAPIPSFHGEPRIVAPYGPDEPALRANRVFIPHDEFMKLYHLANPGALQSPQGSPLGSTVLAAYYQADKLTPIRESQYTLSVRARYILWSDSTQPINVTLPIGQTGFRSAKLDGQEATLQISAVMPMNSQVPAPQQAQQQAPQQQALIYPPQTGSVEIVVPSKGLHIADVEFDVPAQIEAEVGRVELPLRPVAAGTLELTLPAVAEGQPDLEVRVDGRSNVYRREGNVVILPVAMSGTTRIQWQPAAKRAVSDVVYHSDVRSAVAVTDSGVTLRTTVIANIRQGEMNELDVTIPEGYSVQSVSGNDVAGWSTQNTDTTRSVRFLFRRPITDSTQLTVQLFSELKIDEQRSSMSIPISVVTGSTRDSGTVVFLAGTRFQVRSDTLSGVSQMNPQDAQMPDGDELPGRRLLAWRYARHPAEISVRLTRVADEIKAVSLHAARLEEERVLWASQWTTTISGAPRSRLDIVLPTGFLPLKVTATDLRDWYVEEIAAEENVGVRNVLSIQLDRAREGTVIISVQGQVDRGTERTQLELQVPTMADITESQATLGLWLDLSSEIAALSPADWQRSTTTDDRFSKLTPAPPAVILTSNSMAPKPAEVTLRQAVPTMIAESVTVTNVTDTALEVTLTLNWQVTRAASDTFVAEMPTALAQGLIFDVPAQRRIEKTDLGNGRTRVLFQVQQPESDRLFILGAGSLALPSDGTLNAEAPLFVTDGTAATLSGQSHFWVIVNQSAGLLQPTGDIRKDQVGQDQLATNISEELLQQAVTIQRLRAETPSWQLKFPEQHQVSPAMVTLATHTTVIADDGSWRSHHELQVRNQSRQFLPVNIPEDSRILYCRVKGAASRIVGRTTDKEKRQHLIPIPQSGEIASTFVVEFGLAGDLGEDASDFQSKLKSHRVVVPVPEFPEFRNDPEFGITVSRNRWTVYVPRSWQAELVKDPRQTNVIQTNESGLLDIFRQAQMEQARSLLMSAKNAKDAVMADKLRKEINLQLESLSQQSYSVDDSKAQTELVQSLISASDAAAAQFGTELMQSGQAGQQFQVENFDRGGRLGGQWSGQQRPESVNSISNGYLLLQEQNLNYFNGRNNDLLIAGNRPAVDPTTAAPAAGEPAVADRFFFDLPQGGVDLKASGEVEQLDSLMPLEKSIDKRDSKEFSKKESEAKGQENLNRSGSQLLDRARRQSGKGGADEAPPAPEAESRRLSTMTDEVVTQPEQLMLGREPQLMNNLEQLEQNTGGMTGNAVSTDPFSSDSGETTKGRTAAATGMLSLEFLIPQDGIRLDFARPEGNAALTLDVRGSEAVSRVYGLLWAAVCAVSAFIVLRGARSASANGFFQGLSCVIAVASLSGYLILSAGLAVVCLGVFVVSSMCLSVLYIVHKLRQREQSAI